MPRDTRRWRELSDEAQEAIRSARRGEPILTDKTAPLAEALTYCVMRRSRAQKEVEDYHRSLTALAVAFRAANSKPPGGGGERPLMTVH